MPQQDVFLFNSHGCRRPVRAAAEVGQLPPGRQLGLAPQPAGPLQLQHVPRVRLRCHMGPLRLRKAAQHLVQAGACGLCAAECSIVPYKSTVYGACKRSSDITLARHSETQPFNNLVWKSIDIAFLVLRFLSSSQFRTAIRFICLRLPQSADPLLFESYPHGLAHN